jgi:hypothetical protein
MQLEQELSFVALHWNEKVVPAGHGTHVLQMVVASNVVNVPFEQVLQTPCPELLTNVPAAHDAHTVRPDAEAK